jgi:hypothetical protein
VASGIVGRILQRAQLSRWLAAAINGQPVVVVLDGPRRRQIDTRRLARGAGVGVRGDNADRGGTGTGDVADELRQAIAETDEQMRRGTPQLVIVDDSLARRCRAAPRRTPRVPPRHRRVTESGCSRVPAVGRTRSGVVPVDLAPSRRAHHAPHDAGCSTIARRTSWPRRSPRASLIAARSPDSSSSAVAIH